jgi:hypothetical protein
MQWKEYTSVDQLSPDEIIAGLSPVYGERAGGSTGFSEHADELFSEYPHKLLPTIGIEIELPHRQLDRRLDFYMPVGTDYSELTEPQKSGADQVFSDIDNKWGPRIEALKAAGLFVGRDSFAEIISPPYSYNGDLRKLTDYLFNAGLLPLDEELPLHLTLGGIDAREQPLQAQYLARMVELLDGSTDRRIHDPLMGHNKRWTQKNSSGFLLRSSWELAGEHTTGIELRALTARDPQQLAKVLWRAQWLGASMKAWLEATAHERTDSATHVPFEDYERGVLIDAWTGMTRFFDELYDLNGLDLREPWGGPMDNPQAWTGHLVMCSTALYNLDARRQICAIVDGTLEEVEFTTVQNHSRRVYESSLPS